MRAGDYYLTLEGFDNKRKKVNEFKIPVTINPRYELKIESIKESEFVFANDTLSVQFIVQNLSNNPVDISAILNGAGNDNKMIFSLDPDSILIVKRKIKTEKGILKAVKKDILLTASIANLPEINATGIFSYTIIPSGEVKFDPYNRFPINLSTLFVSDNPGGRRLYATLTDLSGSGFIDNENKKMVTFHFQGPDRRGQRLYGIYDEYFMKLTTPKSKFLLGDQTYCLSYLTEFARYGRGAQAEHKFNYFTLGAFVNFPRFYSQIKQTSSLFIGYSKSQTLALNIGYLNKLNNSGDRNNLVTFSGSGTPFRWARLNGEYALGSIGREYKQAYKAELNINYRWLNLFYNFTMAEKKYPGYFTDTRYTMVNGIINLSKKINLGVNFISSHQNMALDTLYGNAPFDKFLYFMVNYTFMEDGRLSMGYNYRDRQDNMMPMKFDYNEKSLKLSLNKRMQNLYHNLEFDYGNTENLLLMQKERQSKIFMAQYSMNYQLSGKLNLSGFVSYLKSNRYLTKDSKNWVYGTSINGNITNKLSLSCNYQSSYAIEEYARNRSLLDGRFIYSPDKNNKVEVSCRYNLVKNTIDKKELAFAIKYVHTFNIPISKKKNIGKLVGRIMNENGRNIAGIILSIGSDQAVTDKNGNYVFPILAAGDCYMTIDNSKAGVFSIPEIPGPYKIDILPGKSSRFDIKLMQAANITGEIVTIKDVSSEDHTYADIKDQMGKLLVEAKNGNEIYRVFTKEDGHFSFEGLRPGQWSVKVYDDGIPAEYELVTGTFIVELGSGQTQQVEVKIKEIRRRIKFQKKSQIRYF